MLVDKCWEFFLCSLLLQVRGRQGRIGQHAQASVTAAESIAGRCVIEAARFELAMQDAVLSSSSATAPQALKPLGDVACARPRPREAATACQQAHDT